MPVFIIDATMTRGAFTADDASRTGEVLRAFAWGVPAFVLARVFAPAYFAQRRTREPMQFALTTVALNIALGATLWHVLPGQGIDGAIGLGLATSIASWINVALLAGTLAKDNTYRIGRAAWSRMLRLAAACAVMGAFIAVCNWRYEDLKVLLWRKEIAVLVVGAAGFVIYAATALLFRAVSPTEIRGALRREKGAAGVETGPGLE
jgi:putative peptidoglycan lipid II flippase